MKKIKFKLIKFHKQILFQIIEQSGFVEDTKSFIETKMGRINLCICEEPEIRMNDYYEGNIIYLRGANVENDNIVTILRICDNENIDDIYDSILSALSKCTKSEWLLDIG